MGVPIERVKPQVSSRLQRERNLEADPRATLLVAHWDTRPSADQEDEGPKRSQPVEGANDGASGTALLLDWIREEIESLGVEGHWPAVARTPLRDNIYNLQRVLCMQVLNESRQRAPEQAWQAWLARHQKAVDYLRQTVNDMRSLPEMDFATLSVALQAVRRMAEG